MHTLSDHRFVIPNLNCGHCVRAITEALQQADPAATVQADTTRKEVLVASEQARETLAACLTEAGYAPA